MLLNELKASKRYAFDINMSEEYRDYDNHDEWGCATSWYGDLIGVEYNFCMDSGLNSSAIYKMEMNEDSGYVETDYSICNHYEIDFDNPFWKDDLEDAMGMALIEFFNL